MKLSFSVQGWQNYSWEDYVSYAEDLGFAGIELHDNMDASLFEKEGAVP